MGLGSVLGAIVKACVAAFEKYAATPVMGRLDER